MTARPLSSSFPGADATVGQLVVERPSRARVFERYGIDYCCGGKLPLREACAKKGVDAVAVLRELEDEARVAEDPGLDWSRASLAELADHIEKTHHEYLRHELPRLSAMSKKVAAVHGEERAELVELARVFAEFAGELFEHMLAEEREVFPMVRALEAGERSPAVAPALGEPVSMMEHEHDEAGRALERMRELTDGYAVPESACGTYRALFDGLAQLELDMHTHVHKENSILFPRAMALEAECAGAAKNNQNAKAGG